MDDDILIECCDDICEDRPFPWAKFFFLLWVFGG